MKRILPLAAVFALGFATAWATNHQKTAIRPINNDEIRTMAVHLPIQNSPDGQAGHTLEVYEITTLSGDVLYNRHALSSPDSATPAWRVEIGGYRYFGTLKQLP